MAAPIKVSAVIPARNEENTIRAAVESLADQPEITEIIVVNDQSTDRTSAVLTELVARIPHLRLMETNALPPGWVGKNFALSLGAAAAKEEWLLFTDADVVHLAGSMARAGAVAAETGAALVSYSPEQEMHTWWERALLPFIFCRLSQNFSYAAISDPDSDAAAANGQYLLIRKDAYQGVGGHKSVASEVVEDVALARLLKHAGYRLYFAFGQGLARARMYRTFRAMWQGWAKNLYPLMIRPGNGLARELLSVIPWVPFLLFTLFFLPLHALDRTRTLFAALGLILLVGRHVAYAGLLRLNRFPLSCILYYGFAVLLYSGVLVASARHYARGSVTWKGREYPITTIGN